MGTAEIIGFATLGIVVFGVLTTTIILFVLIFFRTQSLNREIQRNKILESEIQAFENAAKHISREFHDDIGYDLNIALMQLSSDSKTMNLDELYQRLDSTYKKLQSISRSLSAHNYSDFDLIETLHREFDLLSKMHNIKFELACKIDGLKLQGFTQINVFRICQEAISNSIKHGKADKLFILIEQSDDCILLSIQDNGRGFDTEAVSKNNNGTINMNFRARFLNAQINTQSQQGLGTMVSLKIPLDA